MIKPLKKAIFPVGGLGTRFLPATKAMPKEMLPLVDKPLIHYAFEEAMAAGIEEFIFVTGRNKEIINNHFDHSYELEQTLAEKNKQKQLEAILECIPEPGKISFIRQQQPKGLGHAIWCARDFVQDDEPVAILLADDVVLSDVPCLKQMASVYHETGSSVIAVTEVDDKNISKYGVIKPRGTPNGHAVPIEDMVEKPDPKDAPSNLGIIGRYILCGSIFKHLDSHEIGAGGEIQLTDAMAKTAKTEEYLAHRFHGTRYDCGSKAGFVEATLAFALNRDDLGDEVREFLKNYI